MDVCLPWKDVLRDYRVYIVSSVEGDIVLLRRLLDYLQSKRCINLEQVETINAVETSRARFNKLIDFVSSGGGTAFDELCNGLREFNTNHAIHLADTLQHALGMRSHVTFELYGNFL